MYGATTAAVVLTQDVFPGQLRGFGSAQAGLGQRVGQGVGDAAVAFAGRVIGRDLLWGGHGRHRRLAKR